MKHTDFCKDWEFQYGEPSGFPMMKPTTQMVTLPHDAMIFTDVREDAKGGAETGFYSGSKVSYTKRFEMTKDVPDAQKYILSFDGCAGTMKLVVNGHTLLHHHYAYSPFHADITPYLSKEHNNRITVTVNNTNEPNSRWYSGTGLYRRVELLTSPLLHIAPEGVYVRLEHLENGTAHLRAQITIVNDSPVCASAKISAKLRRHPVEGKVPQDASWSDTEISGKEIIKAHSSVTVTKTFIIEKAALWDIDDPELYELRVSAGDDTETAVFGVRTITMDAKHGLSLNGRPLNLRGGCIHHDNGILGAVALKDAEYRKVKLLKSNGFNALRFAHNPMSSELLSACDELGMLVIDEAFDVWRMEKNDFDFSQYFDTEGETELTNMVLRDRNHPCVFLWSIGNEIPEQGGLSEGYETSRKLSFIVRSLDPSRAVGGALCSFFRGLSDEDNEKYWASIMANVEELKKNGMVNLDCPYGKSIFDPYTSPFTDSWDAVGYNYLRYHYEPTHKSHPDRVMICTESKPRELFEYWEDVKRLPYLVGDFEWTALDYLGEAGIAASLYVDEQDAAKAAMTMHSAQFPARTAGSGDFDICGFEKPQMLYRRIVWGSKETAVVTHDPSHNGKVALLGRYSWGDVQHGYSWDTVPGTEINAQVYSAAPQVELFLNGTSLGKKEAGIAQKYTASFTFPYTPGILTAVSYDENGREVSRDTVRSAKTPAKIRLTMQEKADPIPADGRSLVYVTAEIVDEDNARVPWAEDTLHATVKGAAALAALGSGRSSTKENYTSGSFTTYEGRLLAILRTGQKEGVAELSVHSDLYGDASLSVQIG